MTDNIRNALMVSTVDCILFHPIDTIKTRVQTNKLKYTNLYAGLIPALFNIVS